MKKKCSITSDLSYKLSLDSPIDLISESTQDEPKKEQSISDISCREITIITETPFEGGDLLENPTTLVQQLSVLIAQRSKIIGQINTFLEMIPLDAKIGSLKEDYENYNDAFNEACNNLRVVYINVTADMLKAVMDIAASRIPKDFSDPETFVKAIPNNEVVRIFGISSDDADKLIDVFANNAKACFEVQKALTASAQKITDAAVEYFKTANLKQLEQMLTPLKQQLKDVNRDIAMYKEKMDFA